MKLSRVERWLLANQYKILEHVDATNAESHSRRREVLERGYELHYGWLAEHVYDDQDTLSSDECTEVIDTMSMYDAVQRSYDALDDKSGIKDHDVVYMGYDGNNETTFMAYARYFCSDGGRFDYLRKGGDGFNAHMPMKQKYRAMLPVWKSFGKEYSLTKEQVQAIIEAGYRR